MSIQLMFFVIYLTHLLTYYIWHLLWPDRVTASMIRRDGDDDKRVTLVTALLLISDKWNSIKYKGKEMLQTQSYSDNGDDQSK